MKIYILGFMVLSMFACKRADKENRTVPPVAVAEAAVMDTLMDLQISAEAQGVLGRNLIGKIQEEGTLAALTFCKAEAYRLTDSTATAKKRKIKRVTDKPRNPANQASPEEIDLMDAYRTSLAKGGVLEPIYTYSKGEHYFYNPIVTSELCLRCHGTPGVQITEEVMERIRDLYPEDRAIGYEANQLRGMWRISKPIE